MAKVLTARSSRFWSPATLRGRAVLLAAVATVIVLGSAATLLVASAVSRSAQARLVATGAATDATNALLRDFIDEETGVRGYQLTSNPTFLQPFTEASAALPSRFAALRPVLADELGGPSSVMLLNRISSAHAVWIRDSARPAIQAVADGAPSVLTLSDKRRFDALRAAVSALQADLGARQADAVRTSKTAQAATLLAAVLAALLVVGSLVAAGFAMRNWVFRPLQALAEAADAVTGGVRDQPIRVAGPQEFVRVGDRVEAMRLELIERLAQARRANEGLVQQGPAVLALRAALEPAVDAVDGVEAAGRLEPAEGLLAGDWYDLIRLPQGQLGVILGDVAGHGPGPGVFALRLKHLLRQGLEAGLGPSGSLTMARHWLQRHPDDPTVAAGTMFATCFLAVCDPVTRELTWANAGHLDAYLVSAAQVDYSGDGADSAQRPVFGQDQIDEMWLAPTGPMLNLLLNDQGWQDRQTGLAPGDLVVMATDGITEGRPAGSGEEFGTKRMLAALAAAPPTGGTGMTGTTVTLPLAKRVDAVFGDLRAHVARPVDDCTLVLLGLAL